MLSAALSNRAGEQLEIVRSATLVPTTLGRSVGLEVEAFPMTVTGERLRIEDVAPSLECGLTPADQVADPRMTCDDAAISFEPGGQIEVSTGPEPTISQAIAAQLRVWRRIRDLVPGRVVFAGLDLWNDIRTIPLQLAAPRYPAMDRYFSARSRWGTAMMRHTASIQINLDGGGSEFERRVRIAQVLAPFIVASFAASPAPGIHSRRARVWQRLDTTRTGFLDPTVDLSRGMWEKARAADVMLFRRGGGCHPGTPGFTYATWDRDGHPTWGRPIADDLVYHLTTLFPEVRPRRGTLEIRTPDSLPPRFWPALVVLVSAAVYSVDAGAEIVELAGNFSHHDTWMRAATVGPDDRRVSRLAARLWQVALAAAQAMPTEVEPAHLDAAGTFVEDYAERSHSPSDELRLALGCGPLRGLEWADAD